MRIAFLTADLTSRLSRDIWAGILSAVGTSGVECINYTGGLVNSAEEKNLNGDHNIVYDFISTETVDGVIVYGGDIGQYLGPEGTAAFVKRFSFVPVVNIALEIPGVANVIADNYSGMYAMVSHLITEHGRKNIAFVKGPDGHEEAEERLRAFRTALHDAGMNPDAAPQISGDFSVNAGVAAVKELLLSQPMPDAIVAVDDDTAFGVYQELTRNGIMVPEHIAVCGFDDSPFASINDVPLTTVKQPVFRQGVLAAELMIKMLRGENVPERNVISTEVILRKSCGCSDDAIAGYSEKDLYPKCFPNDTTLRTHAKELISLAQQTLRNDDVHLDNAVLADCIAGLVESLESGSNKTFLASLHRMIHNQSNHVGQCAHLQRIITALRIGSIPYLRQEDIPFFDSLMHAGRIMIGSVGESLRGHLFVNAVEKLEELGAINYALNNLTSIQNIGSFFHKTAGRYFEAVGIKALHISLYVNQHEPLKQSRMLFSWTDGVTAEIPENSQLFSTSELLPTSFRYLLAERNYIVCSLSFEEELYGFALIEISPLYAQVAEVLTWQIGSALKRVFLLAEKEARSNDLQHSLDRLLATQKQLVESEKMASLGNLVAGVAHEINTPVGLGVTYASLLEESTTSFENLFRSGLLKKSDFESYIEKTKQACRGMLINMNRAAELIKSFKDVAIDQTTSEKRLFNVSEYLQEILTSLHGTIKKTKHIITVDCDSNLTIAGYPGALSQIIANFINNSLLHGFEGIESGNISIAVTKISDRVRLEYSDNGIGINEEQRCNIFEPFYTTKRGSGGTGLGMHIVYNLVSQQMNGTILCEGEPGKGVRFVITFPV